MSELPTGTVTFLFTDIEGSGQLWQAHPEAMKRALAHHDSLLRKAIERRHGYVVKMRGDGVHAVFASAIDAVTAAFFAQQALAGANWPPPVDRINVRMGLHTGHAQIRDGDYFGPTVNQAARIQEIGHGGQILLSQATQIVVRDDLPDETSLLDLEEHHIPDVPRQEHIYQLVWPGLDIDFPPLKTRTGRRSNLPEQLTELIGREEELKHINALLTDPNRRLVTIIGPGGIGKTRFSVAAGEQQLEAGRFPNGVYFVALAPLSDVDQIPAAMADALGLSLDVASRQRRTPWQYLLDYLRNKKMLLVMDNFEHLLEGAQLVNEILRAAPDVKVVTTSRERLQLRSEHLCSIVGLEFPVGETPSDAAEYTAVKLLLQCVRQVQPGFEPREADLVSLIRICRLVEGMPLALELAAGWVDMLSLEEIAAEIRESLDFLETEVRDVPERQRSIRAVFDNSWQRLNTEERDALAQFSLFRGGFTREAARHITGVSLRTLHKLANKSLLQYDPKNGRYQIHGLLQQYGEEKLIQQERQAAETPGVPTPADVKDRHSAYYCDLLKELATNPEGKGQDVALAEIMADISNVYAAWRRAVKLANYEVMANSVAGLTRYYLRCGPLLEGEKLLELAAGRLQDSLDRGELPAPKAAVVLSQILASRASLLNRAGQYEAAIVLAKTAVELAQKHQAVADEAMGYLQWGRGLWFQGNYETAHKILEKALSRARASQYAMVEADSLRRLGVIYWPLGQYDVANNYFEQALSIYRKLGNRQGEALTLNNLSIIAIEKNDLVSAKDYLERAVALSRQIGDKGGEARVLTNLGEVCWHLGLFDEALANNEHGLGIHQELGIKRGQAFGLNNLGNILAGVGDYEQAQRRYEEALQIYGEIGELRGRSGVLAKLSLLSSYTSDWQKALRFGQEALDLAQEVGVRRNAAEAATIIGHIRVETGNLPEAETKYREALTIRKELGQAAATMEPVAGLAEIARLKGDLKRAQSHVERILSHLETNNLDGATEPSRVFLTCYHTLVASKDQRDEEILKAAYRQLQARLSHISDPRLKKSFQEEVRLHKEILKEYKRRFVAN